MLIKLVGGLSDGEAIDTNDPGMWAGVPRLPLPEVLEVHVSRGNRTAYRLVNATSDECIYLIDREATDVYRAR